MKLKDLRQRLGIAQTELAELVGAHAMTVSKWERGVARPSAGQKRILRALSLAADHGARVDLKAARKDPARALATLLDHAYREPELDLGALSATNRFAGRVVELKQGDVMSKLVIEIAPGVRIGSVITSDSVDRLNLAIGSRAVAIIKATEVIVGKL